MIFYFEKYTKHIYTKQSLLFKNNNKNFMHSLETICEKRVAVIYV